MIMKLSVVSEKDNPLFKRKELQIEVDHDASATPSKAEVQLLVSKEFKKNIENVDIRSIFSDSGVSSSKAKAFLWEEKKVPDLSKAVKEKKPKEEAKPEEKPKEEEKKEKEEKKEAVREEKKEAK
jgi:ribosomal protein S24E